MRRVGALVAASMIIASTAAAQARDIPFYERNPSARGEILRQCRDDHALHMRADTAADCANAEAAATRVAARRQHRPGTVPGWVFNSPDARAALNKGCDRGDWLTQGICGAGRGR